jgi:hypothetical protein
LRVSTHVTTAIVEGLPVPRREAGPDAVREIAALASSLARRDDALARRRLNVLAARLYGLTSEEYEHVLSTFPLVPEAERKLTFEEFQRGR